ncbi:hypothetical protein [Syntrophomonas palmitatica]|uniref:hypothetical protein n=1 Tax=Syntrophomonas palmitatica TaxID=402877 RepID=UPI0006D11FD8|nr:hypothetical protein [Syntrophomonas palmitatica]
MKYNWTEMTEDQKMAAVKEEMSLVTHNGTTKEDFVEIMRFLSGQVALRDKALKLSVERMHELIADDCDEVVCPNVYGECTADCPNCGEYNSDDYQTAIGCWINVYLDKATGA